MGLGAAAPTVSCWDGVALASPTACCCLGMREAPAHPPCPPSVPNCPQVRNKIKMFAQQKVTLPPGRQKVIILDEADR